MISRQSYNHAYLKSFYKILFLSFFLFFFFFFFWGGGGGDGGWRRRLEEEGFNPTLSSSSLAVAQQGSEYTYKTG